MNYNTVTALSGIAAVIAAGTVSIGATLGFYEMTGSWLTAALVGVTIAVILGIGWHVAIRAGANTRQMGNRFGLLAIGLVFAAIAFATSGWSLATAIGGKSAIEHHQKSSLDDYEQALNAALVRADDQRGLIEAVAVAQSVYTGRVNAEIAGDNGAAGCGPACRQLQATAANLGQFQQGIETELQGAQTLYTEGAASLAQARAGIGSTAFDSALGGVEAAITLLNGINVTDGVSRVGMTTNGANDPLTAQIVGAAEAIDSTPVAMPRYVPMSRAEATLAYWPKVVGAWIAAAAIDFAPFVFLVLVMMLHNEPLIRQQPDMRKRHRPTLDEIRTTEDNVVGIRGAGE